MRYSLLVSICCIVLISCQARKVEQVNQAERAEGQEKLIVADTIRVASYNVAMYGKTADEVKAKLSQVETADQYQNIAAVIKTVRPDILVLMEIDYDITGEVLRLFNDNLLSIDSEGFESMQYPHLYQIATNTGILSEVDLDGDGGISLPNDAYGFGRYPGQYASAILSKYPLDVNAARSFQKFLWKDMPDAALPTHADGSNYYTDEVLDVFRLSSKNHIDIPVVMPNGKSIHTLISHPTPSVFDGPEDKNGKRNHDEIRLWADYISGADYLVDDHGRSGGLAEDDSFIVLGDLNADPYDGDSHNTAINQLLLHPRINASCAVGDLIPSSEGGLEHNQKPSHQGDPRYDTSFFGLRIDYVLPSSDIQVISSGIHWPSSAEKNYNLVADKAASDHLLVWTDIVY